MSGSITAPESQHQNLIGQIQSDLARLHEEEEVSADRAFLTLCINYLGYSLEHGVVTDGGNDCGIDFVEHTTDGATILQAKSVEFTGNIDTECLADPRSLTDLPRIRNLLSSLDSIPSNMKVSLKKAVVEMKATILGSASAGDEPFKVTIYFCFMGKGFTPAAAAEFGNLDSTRIAYGGRAIELTYIPVFLDDLVEEKWKETNNRWANKRNERKEEFDLPICGTAIRDSKSAVFFTKAVGLVDAYKEIGHQIFEANVRCEIKNSTVNKAIRKSVMTNRGRGEFRHLNNGMTVVCESFKLVGPPSAPTAFRVRRPGVINGLQTLKTMHDAASELDAEDMLDFRNKCEVLVRLHTQNSVADFRDLVKSTNNQNPMKPRNLRSNDPEQIAFERLFSAMGWFYERKEGAWSAFSGDPRRWSTLPNRKPADFKTGRFIRKVDNEDIAQAWLSMIGFSEQAVDQKRFLFQHDDVNGLIFKMRTAKHGSAYGYKTGSNELTTEAQSKSPDPKGLLCAYLVRDFALSVVKTRKENRDAALRRLSLEGKSKNEQEDALSKDHDYLQGSILRGMLLLFVDFFGFLLFAAFGAGMHERFDVLLKNHSLGRAAATGDFGPAVELFRSGEYDPDDVLLVAWEFYNHCVAQMIGGAWLRQLRDTANRSKFIYGDSTRVPLFNEVRDAAPVFRRGMLTRVWTVRVNQAGGMTEFLKSTLNPEGGSQTSTSRLAR